MSAALWWQVRVTRIPALLCCQNAKKIYKNINTMMVSLKLLPFLVSTSKKMQCQYLGFFFLVKRQCNIHLYSLLCPLDIIKIKNIIWGYGITFTVNSIILKLKTSETSTCAVIYAEMGTRRVCRHRDKKKNNNMKLAGHLVVHSCD